jgi:hypothetical protein
MLSAIVVLIAIVRSVVWAGPRLWRGRCRRQSVLGVLLSHSPMARSRRLRAVAVARHEVRNLSNLIRRNVV